jgi:nucleotide-binding universal stress UspA family protein
MGWGMSVIGGRGYQPRPDGPSFRAEGPCHACAPRRARLDDRAGRSECQSQCYKWSASASASLLPSATATHGSAGHPSASPAHGDDHDAAAEAVVKRLPEATAAVGNQPLAPRLEIVGTARSRGVEATFLLWTGEPGKSIVAAVEAEGADMVVVGTRAMDRAGRFLLGSVSDYVVYHAACPVLVAR